MGKKSDDKTAMYGVCWTLSWEEDLVAIRTYAPISAGLQIWNNFIFSQIGTSRWVEMVVKYGIYFLSGNQTRQKKSDQTKSQVGGWTDRFWMMGILFYLIMQVGEQGWLVR